MLPHGEGEENCLKNNRLRSTNSDKGTVIITLKNLLVID